MAERLVNVDRSTPMLLPPDMREWLPADHIAHFIIDALESLETSSAKVNQRGTGNEQYPPRLMLGLLVYGYVTGRFSSREIERATHGDVESPIDVSVSDTVARSAVRIVFGELICAEGLR